MRFAFSTLLLTLLAACAAPTPLAEPSAVPAQALTLTTYDDGLSCPGDCDAHVVFHPSLNGTANAFLPAAGDDPLAARVAPKPCVPGEACVICFSAQASSCLVALYRGDGPPPGIIDVTSAFLEAWCTKASLPEPLAAECQNKREDVAYLEGRHNCIADPDSKACRDLMTTAKDAKSADAPGYALCKALGAEAYNSQQPDVQLHRHPEKGCEYFLNQRESNGTISWSRLTPAACRADSYVGKNGLDCCSANPWQAAVDVGECGAFYPAW